MPTWNLQQLKAITTKHKNILVSASAGSGKTTVLIARLLDFVMQEKIPISRILAMTFTEAAANEMKKRLAQELHKLLQTSEDEKEKEYILQQLSALANAHISTIHSFCLSILQEYYYTIALDGERIHHIMDTAQMTLFKQQALMLTMNKQQELKEDAFLKLCIQFSARAENDEQLQSLITSLAVMASSKSDPDTWLTQCATMYQTYQELNDLPKPVLDMFYDYLQTQMIIYQDELKAIEKHFFDLYPSETKKQALIQKKQCGIEPCMQALQQKNYATFKQAFIATCHLLVPTSLNKEDTWYNKTRKHIQQIEDDMLALLFDESIFLSDIIDLQPSIHKIIELCRDYRKNYQTIKEQQQMIDFDDMEHYALQILQANDGAVALKYQDLFMEIMVDEFQDSNDVQNKLVELISRENNVFRVGDIKQSIYGFRHAKPKLMKDLINHKKEQDEVIYLSNNYRSKKTIVDFNNTLFEHLMNIEGFDSSYQEEDNVETGKEEQTQNMRPVIFHVIDHNAINEQQQTIFSKNDFKASYIANKIIEIKQQEDRSWKDFVVLVRGNARKDDMKAAFDELHIPYFIDIKYGFYQSSAVQIVLSFLKFCLHPHDDIALLAVLLSPLGKQKIDTITEAKLQMDENSSYYEYFKQHPFPAFTALLKLRQQASSLCLSEFLNKIYDHQDFYASYTTMQEKTNLDLLFEKAVHFEEEQIGSIVSFLEMIETIKDAQTAEAIPISSEEDVVRVMSIHQSKGLQFPIVFLWSTTNQTAIENKELCICDSDIGIAMKYVQLPNRYLRTTPFRIAMEHKKNKEELEEEMRILYVATTRAQQQLHIVDCIKDMQDYEEACSMSAIYQRNGYTSWILQSFYEHPSSLFQIEQLHTMWPSRILSEQTKENKPMAYYQKEIPSVSFTTASFNSETKELPKLSFQEHNGAAHGSLLHELIENVAYPYPTDKLLQYAKEQAYELREQDIQSLQQLAADPLYKEMITLKHDHELPYMVQDETTILHGYIDFMAISSTDIYLLDFKSDKIYKHTQLIEKYQSQLKTYERAIHLLYPEHTIHLYIYSLVMHEMIPIL